MLRRNCWYFQGFETENNCNWFQFISLNDKSQLTTQQSPGLFVQFIFYISYNCRIYRFDTSIGGLVIEDQFLQIATKLPNDTSLYGLGESEHHSFKHSMFWKKYGMYARDQPPYVSIF